MDEVKAALRNVEAGGEGGVQTDRRARAVDNPCGTGDCVVLGEDGVQQDDFKVGPAVAQGDFERLAGAVQAGQPFEYGLLVKNTMGSVDELRVSRAVGKSDGHAVRAVVARAEDGIFLRQQVKRVGTVCALDVRGRGEVHIPRVDQARAASAAELVSEVKVQQEAVPVDHHLIRGVCRFKCKCLFVFIKENWHVDDLPADARSSRKAPGICEILTGNQGDSLRFFYYSMFLSRGK